MEDEGDYVMANATVVGGLAGVGLGVGAFLAFRQQAGDADRCHIPARWRNQADKQAASVDVFMTAALGPLGVALGGALAVVGAKRSMGLAHGLGLAAAGASVGLIAGGVVGIRECDGSSNSRVIVSPATRP